jgi:hypothetical protein
MTHLQRVLLSIPLLVAMTTGCGGLLRPTTGLAATYTVTPADSLDSALGKLRPGDTLVLKGGTYPNVRFGKHGAVPMPSGTSWERAITIKAAPGEQVILPNGEINMVGGTSYVIFDGLLLKNGGLALDSTAHHIRFQRGELAAEENYNIVSGNGRFLEVLDSKIHGAKAGCWDATCAQTNANYGVYWSGTDALFEGNEVYANAGYAFHIFNSGSNGVSRNSYAVI